eukprot:gnl/MRDRNA2_/MRDRNA2_116712_c0_seq1.p1 gnl/MRDRNA2_/MRDRNA2_116712_c0~~gnl/MRDRNA2_/MRDRNA2_116712_c0_seq1.p1  ORF type:complete len:474 (-),score=88.74 gnl/MRDRNA2_/MRDRNA2_116712_c0_seq1:138-1559(-)
MLASSFHEKSSHFENPMKLPYTGSKGKMKDVHNTGAEVSSETLALKEAVMKMAPHLSQERTSEILDALNTAISATRETQALEGVEKEAHYIGYDQSPYFHAAVGCVKQRLVAQQQQSLQEVQRICLQECVQRAWQNMVDAGFQPGLPGFPQCSTSGFAPGMAPGLMPGVVPGFAPGYVPFVPGMGMPYPGGVAPGVPAPGLNPHAAAVSGAKMAPPFMHEPMHVPMPVPPSKHDSMHVHKNNRRVPGASTTQVHNSHKQTDQHQDKRHSKESGDNRKSKGQTLATSLQALSQENPQCIFIVRRINKLGFKAPRKLKTCFSAFGPVVRVLVAHSTVRQSYQPKAQSRRRPSSLGFVQMRTAAAVQAILAMGDEQVVDGVSIAVQQFSRMAHEEFAEDEEDDFEDSELGCQESPMNEYQESPINFEQEQNKIEDLSELNVSRYRGRCETETTTGSHGSCPGSEGSAEDVGEVNWR